MSAEHFDDYLAQIGALCVVDVEKIPTPPFKFEIVGR